MDPAAAPAPVATPVSAAAEATAPTEKPLAAYKSPNAMVEAGDMAAFMARVRNDYAHTQNPGAWGYMIVDALAADDPATAQTVLDALTGKTPPQWMSANHMRPWVYAANGRTAEAVAEMQKLKRAVPGATLLGHRALLQEGLGDYAAALAVYGEAPAKFDSPDPSEAGRAGRDAARAPRAVAGRARRLRSRACGLWRGAGQVRFPGSV